MFKWLQQKWKVGPKQFWIIFIVFAITGTATAYLTKAITSILGFNDSTGWLYKFMVRAGMLLFGYWFLLLFFGTLFGQYRFFRQFILRFLKSLGIFRNKDFTSKSNIIK
jgi:hypothetical protein